MKSVNTALQNLCFIPNQSSSVEPMSTAPLRILIAEDQDMQQKLIRKVLSNLLPNSEIVIVNQGHLAVEQVEECCAKGKRPFDIIILDDLMPPGQTGAVTAKAIRDFEIEKKITIAAMFTWSDTYERRDEYGRVFYHHPEALGALGSMPSRKMIGSSIRDKNDLFKAAVEQRSATLSVTMAPQSSSTSIRCSR